MQRSEADWRWMLREAREQLMSVLDTLDKLYERVSMLKAKLVHHVDQGEGLTQEELVEIYAEIDRLFPRRIRQIPERLDV